MTAIKLHNSDLIGRIMHLYSFLTVKWRKYKPLPPEVEEIIRQLGGRAADRKLPEFRYDILKNHSLFREVVAVSAKLGVPFAAPVIKIRNFDAKTPSGLVAFDSDEHFNRFRAFTLTASVYDDLHTFPVAEYRFHCMERDNEVVFKPGLSGKSAQEDAREYRLRKMAMEDFLQDVYGSVYCIPVIRISQGINCII
mgnify:FL=1